MEDGLKEMIDFIVECGLANEEEAEQMSFDELDDLFIEALAMDI